MDQTLAIKFDVREHELDTSVDRLDMVGIQIRETDRLDGSIISVTAELALGGVHSNSTVEYIGRYLFWRYLKEREGKSEIAIGRERYFIENEEELVLAIGRELLRAS